MAENVSTAANNARFTEYPYDLTETTSPLQHRRLTAFASRLRSTDTVLDVGCNSGHLIDFVPAGCVLHGVDLSPVLVARALARGYRSAQVAQAETLPFPDKSMDVAILAGVLEYVFDPQVVLRELARVARRTLLVDANHEFGIWGAHRVEDHAFMVRSYDETDFIQEVSAVGRLTWYTIIDDQHRLAEITI